MTMGTPADHAGWVKRAKALKIDAGLFIDGASCDAASGAVIDAINPATGALITQMACGGATDIDRAVASAKRAWDDRRWRDLTPRTRMDIFRRWADLVERDAADLALMETLSMGKPVMDALTIDLPE